MEAPAVVSTADPDDSTRAKDHPIAILNDKVTIAVAAHGNAPATRICLEAIFQSTQGDYELILVDDCSSDEDATLSLFKEAKSRHEKTIVYQTTSENLEYSGSVNVALSHGTGDYIFFISNDIITTPYYFATILKVAADSSNAGTIRGSSNFVDNGLGSHNLSPINSINTLCDVFKEGRDVASLFGDLHVSEDFLTGDAFMVTRQLVDRIGGFDPLFYGYFSDHDYGIRAKIAGLSTLLAPGAYAFHMAGTNIGHLKPEQRERKIQRRWSRVYENWARFKLKYHLPIEMDYQEISMIPWRDLCVESFSVERHFSPPRDYGRFRL